MEENLGCAQQNMPDFLCGVNKMTLMENEICLSLRQAQTLDNRVWHCKIKGTVLSAL
jgi:hypothetical protein